MRGPCKCCKCGETDSTKFYSYNSWTCKRCHYLKTKIGRTPEQRHAIYVRRKVKAYEESKRSRERNRDIINARQQERRKDETQRLIDRLNCEARRIVGKSRTRLSVDQMRTLLYVRLFKLCSSGTLKRETAQVVITNFEEGDHLKVLLSAYKHKTMPNVLLRQTVHNQFRG